MYDEIIVLTSIATGEQVQKICDGWLGNALVHFASAKLVTA
ncbi:hypothetical protein HMPREF0494_0109 [Limosilactobacillus antri DSM 16041]|uniref:Uncharacterized protein n=1 Tax=Limosilactobacillus antri DSM 16041 TaxID=525309 RepID=C8P465_9LACO|nr:hypothetical protein HMPREF0494_0109 [Limosilactobacillus antri DSM 16041]